MSWTIGDISGSETLTDNDHLYAVHINELRTAFGTGFVVTVGTSSSVGSTYTCDGTADEVQINAAITFLNGVGGGTLFIKRGTYNVATPVILGSLVHIVGEGIGATIIKQASGGNDNTFYGNALSYFSVRDLTIDGNKTQNASGDNGVALYDCTDYSFVRVRSTANNIKGFVTVNLSADGLFFKCESDNNHQDGFGFASDIAANNKICERISVINCYSHDNDQYGIGLIVPNNTFAQTKDMLLLGNTVKNNGTYGIEVFGSKNPRIIGNVVIGSGQQSPSTAIGLDLGSSSSPPAFLVTRAKVIGNIFKNSKGVSGTDSIGINLQNGDDCIFTGNSCFDDQDVKTQAYGFRYGGGLRNIIALNNFSGNLTSSVTYNGALDPSNIYGPNIE